jgi:hypothetical protein
VLSSKVVPLCIGLSSRTLFQHLKHCLKKVPEWVLQSPFHFYCFLSHLVISMHLVSSSCSFITIIIIDCQIVVGNVFPDMNSDRLDSICILRTNIQGIYLPFCFLMDISLECKWESIDLSFLRFIGFFFFKKNNFSRKKYFLLSTKKPNMIATRRPFDIVDCFCFLSNKKKSFS